MLQAVIVALHSVVLRQSSVIQHVRFEAASKLGDAERRALQVATLRRERSKQLAGARRVHGPSASPQLMLQDLLQFAETIEVLDAGGESERRLSDAIESYIRSDKRADKNLRKKLTELRKALDTKLDEAILLQLGETNGTHQDDKSADESKGKDEAEGSGLKRTSQRRRKVGSNK